MIVIGKGDKRRPPLIGRQEYDKQWDELFPPKQPDVMSEEERAEFLGERERLDNNSVENKTDGK